MTEVQKTGNGGMNGKTVKVDVGREKGLYKEGRYELAIEKATKRLYLEGDKKVRSAICLFIARCYGKLGKNEEAQKFTRQAREEARTAGHIGNPNFMKALAETYEEIGDLQRALGNYETIKGQNPEFNAKEINQRIAALKDKIGKGTAKVDPAESKPGESIAPSSSRKESAPKQTDDTLLHEQVMRESLNITTELNDDTLTWEEAQKLGFTKEGFAFFDAAGVEGGKTDGVVTRKELNATLRIILNKDTIRALTTGDKKPAEIALAIARDFKNAKTILWLSAQEATKEYAAKYSDLYENGNLKVSAWLEKINNPAAKTLAERMIGKIDQSTRISQTRVTSLIYALLIAAHSDDKGKKYGVELKDKPTGESAESILAWLTKGAKESKDRVRESKEGEEAQRTEKKDKTEEEKSPLEKIEEEAAKACPNGDVAAQPFKQGEKYIKVYEKALETLKKDDDLSTAKLRLARAYIAIGGKYAEAQDFVHVLDVYLKAVDLKKNLGESILTELRYIADTIKSWKAADGNSTKMGTDDRDYAELRQTVLSKAKSVLEQADWKAIVTPETKGRREAQAPGKKKGKEDKKTSDKVAEEHKKECLGYIDGLARLTSKPKEEKHQKADGTKVRPGRKPPKDGKKAVKGVRPQVKELIDKAAGATNKGIAKVAIQRRFKLTPAEQRYLRQKLGE